ncbi:GPN-loop GTPase 3 [Orchesella cincta]|uniref:GPN-loop GTPase 3 n=1 Tax=Orchesella cincta TaxID=48709 RepID=A0A1D2ND38_ORCCI|nr:GPN-loop GTPase 3 [Orchesella cincta]
MRYAQIIMGLKDSGKSTYCKLMAKYAESKGRKMRIVNLDPSPGELVYDHPIADIREVVKTNEAEEGENSTQSSASGFELALGYILDNPDWLFGSIGELKDGDYILFDCPGESQYYIHSKSMKVFAAMLVVKSFRTCGVFVRDGRMGLNGYNFIGSCLTPLTSYINLSIPHVGLMMKIDLLTDDDKSKLQLFINSDIKDVLRYENSRYKNFQCDGQPELAKLCSSAVAILEGHSMVRKKYYALDIKDEESFKGFLDIVDDLLGIILEED